MIRWGIILGLLLSFQFSKAQQWVGVDSATNRIWFAQDTSKDLLFITGHSKYINQLQINGAAEYNGATYSKLGKGGTNCERQTFCDYTNRSIFYKNELYINLIGRETLDDTIQPNGIARWNGSKWDHVGMGLRTKSGYPGWVGAFAIHNNELYVAGNFDSAGSVAAKHVAKWDGNTWYSVADSVSLSGNGPNCIASFQGDLYIGGVFTVQTPNVWNILKWNGMEWKSVTSGKMFRGGLDGINTMTVYRDELYVGGYFLKPNSPGNFIARWNGKEWREVGDGIYPFTGGGGSVYKMKVINDKLFVAGQFDKASDIDVSAFAVWNGEQWCTFDTTNFLNEHILTRIYDFSYYRDTLYTSPAIRYNGQDYFFMKWAGSLEPTRCGKKWHVSTPEVEKPEENSVSVFPNPGTSRISVLIDSDKITNGEMHILDIHGKILFSKSIKTNEAVFINIEWLVDGTYIIAFKNSRTLFIKQ